jgi:hypothetical protein
VGATVTYDACITIGPLFDGALENRPGRCVYQRGGLKLLREVVPVLVDHDDSRPVGLVRELWEFQDVDGPWLVAHAEISDPPAWLKTGTKASVAFSNLHDQHVNEWRRILRGLVTEVSILSPGVLPAEPLAQVVLLRETASESERGGQLIHGGALIRRAGIGQVLAVGGIPVR